MAAAGIHAASISAIESTERGWVEAPPKGMSIAARMQKADVANIMARHDPAPEGWTKKWEQQLRSVVYVNDETAEVKFSATGETTTGAVKAAVSITVKAQAQSVLENVEKHKEKGISEGHALYGKDKARRRSVAGPDGELFSSAGLEGPKLVKATTADFDPRSSAVAAAAAGLGVDEYVDSDDDMYAAPTLAGKGGPTDEDM